MLMLLSFTGLFFYLQQTLFGVLNGLGKETTTLKHSMITSIMRLGFVWIGIPYLGIHAYIAGLVFTNLVGAVLNLRTAMKTTGISIELGDWFIKPIIAALSGFIAGPVIKQLMNSIIHIKSLAVVTSAGLAGTVMVAMLMLMGGFEFKDVKQMLPFHIE